MKPVTQQRAGIFYGILAALGFTTYVSVNRYVYLQYSVNSFSYSATFVTCTGLVALASLCFAHLRQNVITKNAPWGRMVLIGLVAGIAMGLVAYGQSYTTAVNASIILAASTIPTLLFSHLLLKENITKRQFKWLALMFAGVYFAVVGDHLIYFNRGDVIILAAIILLGFTNSYPKTFMAKTSSGLIADVRLAVGGLLFVALGLMIDGGSFLVTSAGAWPFVAGFFLWLTVKSFYEAIHLIGPNRAIILANGHPVVTPFVGVLLLGEPYSWAKAVGSAVLLLSIYQITKN